MYNIHYFLFIFRTYTITVYNKFRNNIHFFLFRTYTITIYNKFKNTFYKVINLKIIQFDIFKLVSVILILIYISLNEI